MFTLVMPTGSKFNIAMEALDYYEDFHDRNEQV
jgi:hypothetical protein